MSTFNVILESTNIINSTNKTIYNTEYTFLKHYMFSSPLPALPNPGQDCYHPLPQGENHSQRERVVH